MIARYKTTMLLLGAYAILLLACLTWVGADSGLISGLEVAGLAAVAGVPLYIAAVYIAYGLMLFIPAKIKRRETRLRQILSLLAYPFLLVSSAMAAIIVVFTVLNILGIHLSQDIFIRLIVILHVAYIVGSFYLTTQASEPQ